MREALAADPVKVGFSMGLTGANAPNGKQLLIALEIWRDDVNAKGGLLGRPVELVYYDDQTNPSNENTIYTKLIDVDKVNLLLGPYGTNQISAALPVIAPRNLTTIGILGTAANSEAHYKNYFSMIPLGPDPKREFSRGFFEVAVAQNPKPKTVALVGADAEFGKNATDGARENAKAAGLTIVYDQRYPPATTDMTPVVRAIKATNPDIVFVGAYPPELRRLRARRKRSRPGAQADGWHDDWSPGHTTQDPDGTSYERLHQQCRGLCANPDI